MRLRSFRSTPPGRWTRAAPAVLVLIAPAALTGQEVTPPPDAGLPARALSDRAPYRLAYDHVSGVIELRDPRDRLTERWETRAPGSVGVVVRLPPDRPLVVSVENANPLLYRYDVEAAPVAQGNVRACSSIGGDFARRGTMLGVGAFTGQSGGLPDLGSRSIGPDLLQLWDDAVPGASRGGEEDGRVSEEALAASFDRVRAPLTDYAETLETVGDLSRTIVDSLRLVAELGDALPVDSMLAALQARLERRQPGSSDPARLPTALRQGSAAVAPLLEALATLEAAIADGRYDGTWTDPAVLGVRALDVRLERARAEAESGYAALRNALLRIERARRESRQLFTLPPSGEFRRITVVTAVREGFDDVIRTRDGRLSVYTEPWVSTRCELSIGFTFMDEPPRFDLRDGVLVDEMDDETRTTAALMILVSSSSFPLVGALAGVGIGADRVPDLYLGGSLRFLDPVMINAGVVWQREHRLPGDLVLGQTLADESTLQDLPRSYRASTFIGVSLVR